MAIDIEYYKLTDDQVVSKLTDGRIVTVPLSQVPHFQKLPENLRGSLYIGENSLFYRDHEGRDISVVPKNRLIVGNSQPRTFNLGFAWGTIVGLIGAIVGILFILDDPRISISSSNIGLTVEWLVSFVVLTLVSFFAR